MKQHWIFLACVLCLVAAAAAQTVGVVHGIVHDPEHRPISGAEVVIRATTSDWSTRTTTDESGYFRFTSVPLGRMQLTADASGFSESSLALNVTSTAGGVLHIPLAIATATASVTVKAEANAIETNATTTQILVDRRSIQQTPGADRTDSLAVVTDNVPGATVVHNQLHIRGGHQYEWQLDGVPVPNTNIASNVGPQFDPKDIDVIEVQRGGFGAATGDRTYGAMNVQVRSGFERNREAEFVLGAGNFYSTDDQFSIGNHSERLAWYASVGGNRSDLGLETPTTKVLHDMEGGLSAFSSWIYNARPTDQLRGIVALRGDHFQVPNDPTQQLLGIRDVEDERDDFLSFAWIHSSHGFVTTLAPFYHFNRAHYLGGPNDVPFSPEDDRGSQYAGGTASVGYTNAQHNARVGLEGWSQRDNQFFRLTSATTDFRDRVIAGGAFLAAFAEDAYSPWSWLTLTGGVRLSSFHGGVDETVADPRIGAVVVVPHLRWRLHGFYGRYYQAPPLLTVSGPVVGVAAQTGFGFLPLFGERDEQVEAGVLVPVRGWSLDVTGFRTHAHNFFDHDVLGNSNIFFPLTIAGARIYGAETALRSPRIRYLGALHVNYSHQFAQGTGGVTGGLTDFSPVASGLFFLDHDQRDTVSSGLQTEFPRRIWASAEVNYGSGFLNGDGPFHLRPHTTFDLSLGKSFGDNLSARVSALNVLNHRYLLDNSNTFGGTHYAPPHQFTVQLRYRFHY
jgi:TonB-dependent receptor-like protein/carboxypeptidase family protein